MILFFEMLVILQDVSFGVDETLMGLLNLNKTIPKVAFPYVREATF